MRYRGIIERDILLFAEGPEFFGCEVGSIVRDDAIGNPEAIYDRLNEIDCCSGSRTCDGYWFNPLGELVDCYQEMCVSSLGGFSERPDHIEPHWAKGQASGIVFNADAGAYGFVANFWQPINFLTMSSASLSVVG